jgi:hypothetical protein
MTEDERGEYVSIARQRACDLHRVIADLAAIARNGDNEYRAQRIEKAGAALDSDVEAMIAFLERGEAGRPRRG